MKRFYKAVSILNTQGGFQVALDGRGIKTAKGAAQIVPSRKFAEALGAEWEEQGETINPQSFALRDLTDYAIDVVRVDQAGLVEKLLGYGDTDTLLYRADPDEPLFARQQEIWEPIVANFEAQTGLELVRISGIMHRPQSEAAITVLRQQLLSHDAFALAGIEAMTTLAASLIIGLTACESDDEETVTVLWQAASLEEEWQAELWGRDEEAEERRTKRQKDFLQAHKAARLAQLSD